MTDILPAGTAYMYDLLAKWNELVLIGEEYRENMLNGRTDPYLHARYVAKLTRLWLELWPKVDGRSDFEDISKEYGDYEKYYQNPSLFLETAHADDIFKLEKKLREVLERLRITDFEKV